jgi:hypothetical protein
MPGLFEKKRIKAGFNFKNYLVLNLFPGLLSMGKKIKQSQTSNIWGF